MKPEVKKELFASVTAGLVEQMEQGVAIWQKPWVVSRAFQPQNGFSGRLYSGFNRMYLGWLQADVFDSQDPRWFTMNNVKQIEGARVRKGSKSTVVVYNAPAQYEKKNESTGEVESKTWWNTKYYRVFHASQVDGLPVYDVAEDVPVQEDASEHYPGMSVLDSWCHDNLHSYEFGGDRACYIPLVDTIQMPEPCMFKRQSWFVQTLAHEVVHATGAEKRLNRLEKCGFGSDSYAKEELVAEFGGAMICGALHVPPDMEQSAAYLKGWAARCKDDPSLLVSAANMAEKAVDFVLEAGND